MKPFPFAALLDAAVRAVEIAFTATCSRSRSRYLADDLSVPLAFGVVESKPLTYDSEAIAMTDDPRDADFD